MQVCKPGSVPRGLLLRGSCHLSSPDFAIGIHRSTHPGIPLSQKSNEQLFARGLFDLSTHKVCLASAVTIGTVGSYPTFSPLPFDWLRAKPEIDGRFVSVALSVFLPSPVESLPVRKYGALCCPDFPLSRPRCYRDGTAARRLARCKVRHFSPIG